MSFVTFLIVSERQRNVSGPHQCYLVAAAGP